MKKTEKKSRRKKSYSRKAYLGRYPYNLVSSGNLEKYYQTLTDFEFLTAKINDPEFGVQALIEDYDLIDDAELLTHPKYNTKTVKALKLIKAALKLSAHILEQNKTQLAAQLWGRLQSFDIPEIQAMLVSAKQSKMTWLCPLTPSLYPPTGRLVRTFVGHSGKVTSVAITPDGKQVISGSSDNTVIIWDFKTGQKLFTLEGHTKPVTAVAVTPDGKHIISGSEDTTLKVWDLQTAKETFTFNGHQGSINAIVITSDSKQVISSSTDATLRCWNLKNENIQYSKTIITQFPEGNDCKAVAITHDNKWVISCWFCTETYVAGGGAFTADWKEILFFNLENKEIKIIKIFGNNLVSCFAINRDNNWGVFNWESSNISIWNLENLLKEKVNFSVNTLEFIKQEITKNWNLATHDPTIFTTLTGHAQRVKVVAFTQDSKQVISASDDKTLIVWDWENSRKLFTLQGHTDSVNTIALSPDGKYVISGSSDKTLKIWNLNMEEEQFNLTSSDQLLAVPDTVKNHWACQTISDCQTDKKIFPIINYNKCINGINVIPDGTLIISVFSDSYKNLEIYNLTTGNKVHTINIKNISVNDNNIALIPSIAISQSIKHLIYDFKKAILIRYNLEKRRKSFFINAPLIYINVPLFYIEIGKFSFLIFLIFSFITLMKMGVGLEKLELIQKLYKISNDFFDTSDAPSGIRVVLFSIYYFIVVELLILLNNLFDKKISIFIDKNFSFVIVSPDGERVFSCYYKTINVWNLKNTKKLFILKGHADRVTSIAITPDGNYLISGSIDKTLKVWNLKNGKELFTLRSHNDSITSVAVTADGKQVISASKDKTLKIWDLEKRLELFSLIDNNFVDKVIITLDGKQVISGSWGDNIIKVWDLESKKVIASFSGDSQLRCCALAPDGVTIIAGEASGQVHFLRLEGMGDPEIQR